MAGDGADSRWLEHRLGRGHADAAARRAPTTVWLASKHPTMVWLEHRLASEHRLGAPTRAPRSECFESDSDPTTLWLALRVLRFESDSDPTTVKKLQVTKPPPRRERPSSSPSTVQTMVWFCLESDI